MIIYFVHAVTKLSDLLNSVIQEPGLLSRHSTVMSVSQELC